VKSNDVSWALPLAMPPDRQLSPLHGQFTSLAASVSLQPAPSLDANRGEMTIASSSAPARKAAASAVVK
jgi:hypothetical protein